MSDRSLSGLAVNYVPCNCYNPQIHKPCGGCQVRAGIAALEAERDGLLRAIEDALEIVEHPAADAILRAALDQPSNYPGSE